MRITIVMGFFLPMPPVAGGATEKSWDGLAREFSSAGHQVTILSRRWPGFSADETLAGVRHRRLPGDAHAGRLLANLWRDLLWSWRVWRALPDADVTIVNCVALPALLGWLPRRSGHIVLMPGRMPKGQYRLYRRVDRILAVSSPVKDRVLAENPRLRPVTKIFGYPIDWQAFSAPRAVSPSSPITIGYIGRIHREKGLELLVSAIERLATVPDLPSWRFVLCGPTDVARGGSGEEFRDRLHRRLRQLLPPERCEFREPIFAAAPLVALYRQLDVFCYPSLAAQGETFGVAVAEAMAAGAVPVVSRLPCFTDFVRAGVNGETFDHTAADRPAQLADAIARLLQDADRRHRLAAAAREAVRRYDFPNFAAALLADFSTLK